METLVKIMIYSATDLLSYACKNNQLTGAPKTVHKYINNKIKITKNLQKKNNVLNINRLNIILK